MTSPNPFERADDAAARAEKHASLRVAVVDRQFSNDVRVRYKGGEAERIAAVTNELPSEDEVVLVGALGGDERVVVNRVDPSPSGGLTEVFSGDYTRPNTSTWQLSNQVSLVNEPWTTKHAVEGDNLWFMEESSSTGRLVKFDTVNETFFQSSSVSIRLSQMPAAYDGAGSIWVFVNGSENPIEYDISTDSWTTHAGTLSTSDAALNDGSFVYYDGTIFHILTRSGRYYTYDPSADSFTTQHETDPWGAGSEKILLERSGAIRAVVADSGSTQIYEDTGSGWNSIATIPEPPGDWGILRPFYYDGSDKIWGYIGLGSAFDLSTLCYYSFSNDAIELQALNATPKAANNGGIVGMINSEGDAVLGPTSNTNNSQDVIEKTPPALDYESNVAHSVTDEFEGVQTYVPNSSNTLDNIPLVKYAAEDFENGKARSVSAGFSLPIAPGEDIIYNVGVTNIKEFRYD